MKCYCTGLAQVLLRAALRPGLCPLSLHSPAGYMQKRMQRGLALVEHVPEGVAGNPFQNQVLLRTSRGDATVVTRKSDTVSSRNGSLTAAGTRRLDGS